MRHLLSHTAGLDDGLGYGGFATGEPVQRIEESLSGPRDSTVGAIGEVTIVREPGTAMAYSGGGYAVLQLLVEEVTGQTAHDVARFAQAFIHPNPVLKPETVQQLLTAQPSTGGSWGLGHALFADAGPAARVVGHDGGTPPSWGASVRVNPASGNGVVLLASGGGTLVTTLADAWTYGETGVVRPAARQQQLVDSARPAAIAALAGALLIVLLRHRADGSARLRPPADGSRR